MILDAVAVTSKDMSKTVAFYTLLGFSFPEFGPDTPHLESKTSPNKVRLMIDSSKLIEEILGYPPFPANHSNFALLYDSPAKVDSVAANIPAEHIVKAPWDAFWEQRYCIVKDPDGYLIDLFSPN